MNARRLLFELLSREQQLRFSRTSFERDTIDNLTVPTWVLAERRAMLGMVNKLRSNSGLGPIDEVTLVRLAESEAVGHCDYSTKYALYASELVGRTDLPVHGAPV